MDAQTILNLPFVQIALPVMFTMWLTWLAQSKRFDDLRTDMNRQFEEVRRRLERIETKLESHNERIARLEERTSPLHH